MAFDPNQRPAAPWSNHHWWGKYTDALTLPNMAASDTQVGSLELQAGDIAWSEADAALYVCTNPVAGAAVWVAIGGGDIAANVSYDDALVLPPLGATNVQDAIDALKGSSPTSVLGWGQDNVGSSTTTRYLTPGWDDGIAPTVPRQIAVPRAGTLNSMIVVQQTPLGNGNNITYTLRVNGIPSMLAVTIQSTGGFAANFLSPVAVVPTDIIDIEVTKVATIGNSPLRVGLTLELF